MALSIQYFKLIETATIVWALQITIKSLIKKYLLLWITDVALIKTKM